MTISTTQRDVLDSIQMLVARARDITGEYISYSEGGDKGGPIEVSVFIGYGQTNRILQGSSEPDREVGEQTLEELRDELATFIASNRKAEVAA